jgi:hypothetical protein
MTELQAYQAMFCFLEHYYQQTHSDDVASLLGEIELHDGKPLDPAARQDWLSCVKQVMSGSGQSPSS